MAKTDLKIGVLNRLGSSDKQTLGHLTIYDQQTKVFDCVTLELADRNNRKYISRIPKGVYACVKRFSAKHKTHYIIRDVDQRELVLIHAGNYYTQTQGCILVGRDLTDLNNDKHRDVTSSKATLRSLTALAGFSFKLIINDIS